ncbi:MAG: TM0106 family RecB-like putative nuclease, partial [Candidatus Binatia bacterium]
VHPTELPHVYLIGCWDAKRDQFVKFLARGAQDEGRIFEEFLDYVGDAENACLYHWTDFEIGQMTKVIQRWPATEGPLRKLISSCVDLKQIIQSAVYLPVPTFSLKSVAPALGFRWRQESFGAFESMVCYWDYLDDGEKSTINKAILYNEDDCVSMWHIDQELTRQLGG